MVCHLNVREARIFSTMYARRMDHLPPYLFARIDEMKAEKIRSGVDVIDLGVGDPDLPTPAHIVRRTLRGGKGPCQPSLPLVCRSSRIQERGGRLVRRPFRGLPRSRTGSALPDGLEGRDRPYRRGFREPRGLCAFTEPGLPGLPDRNPLCRRKGPRDAA